jgi:hypothetical protein
VLKGFHPTSWKRLWVAARLRRLADCRAGPVRTNDRKLEWTRILRSPTPSRKSSRPVGSTFLTMCDSDVLGQASQLTPGPWCPIPRLPEPEPVRDSPAARLGLRHEAPCGCLGIRQAPPSLTALRLPPSESNTSRQRCFPQLAWRGRWAACPSRRESGLGGRGLAGLLNRML